ncbi:MAG: Cof-type HAD-IIB family hydrolase [Paramuribaculum sp.]|nr:Cof-type HAD-IIB family hydrolase [Paramuribaculum sp.]
MSHKQLFISDMDGTLLSPDSRISAESARIISDLSRNGALITVATARTPATVEPLLKHVVTTPPAIVMTGAAFWNRERRCFTEPQLMTDSMSAEIRNLCRKEGINPMVYTVADDNTHLKMFVYGTPGKPERKFIEERTGSPLKRIHLLDQKEEPTFHSRTVLQFAIGEAERIYAVAEQLRNRIGCAVSAYPDIFHHDLAMLEIFAPGVSKAAATERLRSLTGADEVVVFGDNLNDLPMMAVADRAIAVGNALEAVRDAADEIIGANSTDSVARYIATHYFRDR